MENFVIVSGSLRKDSLNTLLALVWAEAIKSLGAKAEVVPSEHLNVQLFNEDDKESRFPASLIEVSEKIKKAAGVVVCTPEYNGGISPVIKNMIDWTSTLSPHPWRSKPVLLSGTSPGALAAVAGLLHTRNPFDRLGAFVFPQSFGVAQGHSEIFRDVLHLKDSKKQQMLLELSKSFLAFSAKINS